MTTRNTTRQHHNLAACVLCMLMLPSVASAQHPMPIDPPRAEAAADALEELLVARVEPTRANFQAIVEYAMGAHAADARGYVARVHPRLLAHVSAWPDHAREASQRSVRFGEVGPWLGLATGLELVHEGPLPAVVASPHARGLRSLTLHNPKLTRGHVAAIAASPNLSGLEVLEMVSNGLEPSRLEPLWEVGKLTNLRELVIGHNTLGLEGAKALASSKLAAQLEVLSVYNTRLDGASVAVLAASERLAGLHTLVLAMNEVCLEGARALARSTSLRNLRSLQIDETHARHCRMGARGTSVLVSSPVVANLVSLNLGGQQMGDEGAWAIASAENLSKLETLILYRNMISGRGFEVMMEAPHLARLEMLSMHDNPIGDRGLMAMARSEFMGNLRQLYITGVGATDDGLIALAESRSLGALEDLDARQNAIGDATARAISAAPWLGSIRTLALGGGRVSDMGYDRIERAARWSDGARLIR